MTQKRFDVFTVREPTKEGQKSFWVRIGTAFQNKDGSLSVLLDAVPINGKLQIREPYEKDDRQGGFGGGGGRQAPRQQQQQGRGHRDGDDIDDGYGSSLTNQEPPF